jgi:RNA polymerase-binding transcription factor DksA
MQFPSDLLEEIRKHLEEEKTVIENRIDELTKQDPFTDSERLNDNAASDAEATEENNHDRYQAMIDELKAKRISIDDALIRIGSGTYGTCVQCGKMIDTDRLSVLPATIMCMDCETSKKK